MRGNVKVWGSEISETVNVNLIGVRTKIIFFHALSATTWWLRSGSQAWTRIRIWAIVKIRSRIHHFSLAFLRLNFFFRIRGPSCGFFLGCWLFCHCFFRCLLFRLRYFLIGIADKSCFCLSRGFHWSNIGIIRIGYFRCHRFGLRFEAVLDTG